MKRVFNLLIVDESGSMSVIQKQALMGLNETLETIQKMQQLHPNMEQRVTLITFDDSHRRLVFDNVPASETHLLTTEEYRPGGCTPLYDAIGLGISKLNALSEAADNVLVTIITDGMENASQEYSLKMIRTLIEKLKHQHWTFTLIGTDNLDVESMAGAMAIGNHLSFHEDEDGTKKMFAQELCSRVSYNSCLAKGMNVDAMSYFDVSDSDGDSVGQDKHGKKL